MVVEAIDRTPLPTLEERKEIPYVGDLLRQLEKAGWRGNSEVTLNLLNNGMVEIYDGHQRFLIEGLDRLGDELQSEMKKDWDRSREATRQLDNTQKAGLVEVVCYGVSAATLAAGGAGALPVAAALVNGAHLLATQIGYDRIASTFTSDTKQQGEIAEGLKTFGGMVSLASSLISVATGGVDLAKGFEKATQGGMGLASNLIQTGAGMVKSHSESSLTILQADGKLYKLRAFEEIPMERQELQNGMQASAKAQEHLLEGVMNQLRMESETTEKVMGGQV